MSITAHCLKYDVKVAPLNRPLKACEEVNERMGKNLYGLWNEEILKDEYFTFAFVRNPWDRMVSCWKTPWVKRPSKDLPFKEFLKFILEEKSDYFSNSHAFSYFHEDYMLFDESGNQIVNFIGRFEELERDFFKMCEKMGTRKELGHRNKSNRKAYWEYYDEESAALVEEHYKRDIEYFDYKFRREKAKSYSG